MYELFCLHASREYLSGICVLNACGGQKMVLYSVEFILMGGSKAPFGSWKKKLDHLSTEPFLIKSLIYWLWELCKRRSRKPLRASDNKHIKKRRPSIHNWADEHIYSQRLWQNARSKPYGLSGLNTSPDS